FIRSGWRHFLIHCVPIYNLLLKRISIIALGNCRVRQYYVNISPITIGKLSNSTILHFNNYKLNVTIVEFDNLDL
ncbi:hypothetical protein GIB67_000658, partial [Kingdonia uniflora]